MGKRLKRVKDKNNGMTLVELLVVITIIGIAAGFAALGSNLASSRDVEQCAKSINTMLEEVRMTSISRSGDVTLDIDVGGGRNTMVMNRELGGTIHSSETRLPSRVTVTFPDFPTVEIVTIAFDKSSGKVTRITGPDTSPKLLRIRCTNVRGTTATVILVANTGKHYVEYGS